MVKTMTSFIFASLLLVSISLGAANPTRKEVRFFNSVVEETKTFMASQGGFGLNQYDMLVYTKSSYRVAKMFPSYPSRDIEDRVKKYMSWGGQESVWKPNYVAVNIPGAKYATGRVKFFSVDFDWTGINSENTEWAYWIASCIQNNRPLPKSVHPNLRAMLKDAKIPKKLKLKRIDTQLAKNAKHQYLALKAMGIEPNKIGGKIFIPYSSNTQDDVDSMLIYRVIIEMDRTARGWPEGSYRKDLYEHLSNLDLGMTP